MHHNELQGLFDDTWRAQEIAEKVEWFHEVDHAILYPDICLQKWQFVTLYGRWDQPARLYWPHRWSALCVHWKSIATQQTKGFALLYGLGCRSQDHDQIFDQTLWRLARYLLAFRNHRDNHLEDLQSSERSEQEFGHKCCNQDSYQRASKLLSQVACWTFIDHPIIDCGIKFWVSGRVNRNESNHHNWTLADKIGYLWD